MSTDQSGQAESEEINQELNLQNLNNINEDINNEEEINEENEEESEAYIDPNDLIMINNPENWEPSEEQINGYINQMNFETDFEIEEVKKIAYKALKWNLPNNLIRAFTKENFQVLYIDLETNEIHLSTEIEENAKEEYEKLREKKAEKIFYPNDLGDNNNNINNNNNNNENSDNIHIENNNMLIEESDDEDKSEKENELNNNKKKENNINKKEEDEKEDNYNIDYDNEINMNIRKKNKKELNKSFEQYNELAEEENEEEEDKIEYNKFNEDKFTKNINLDKLKSDYVENAKKELKKFKDNLKKKYVKEKKEFYINYDEQCEKRILIEKRKQKDNISNLNKKEIEELEEKLFNDIEKELDNYKKKLLVEFENTFNQNEKNEEEDYSFKYLDMKKNNLLSQIKAQKAKKENLKNKKEQMLKELIKEKKKEINEKKKIYDNQQKIKIKKNENDLEIEFEKYKKNIEIQIKNQKPKKNKKDDNEILENINNILNDYQKLMDDNLEIKKIEIKKELELKKKSDLKEFENNYEKRIKNEIEFIKSNQSNLQKQFYDQLEDLREKSRKNSELNSEFIYNKIEENELNINLFKNKLSQNLDKKIDNIKNDIDNIINKDNSFIEIEKIEKAIEDLLFEILGKETIIFNNQKSKFDINEKEYKEKKLKLNYFIELLNYIIRTIIDNSNILNIQNEEIEEKKLNDILLFGKDILNKYKVINLKEINDKLFPYLDMIIQKIRDSNISELNFNRNESVYPINNINLIDTNRNLIGSNYNNQVNQSIYFPNNNLRNPNESTIRFRNSMNEIPSYQDNIYNNNINSNINNIFKNSINDNYKIDSNNNNYDNKSLNNFQSSNVLFPENKIFLNNTMNQSMTYDILKKNIPELPKEITSNLNENTFQLYSQIIDFLYDESTYLSKEYDFLDTQRNANEQLSLINERGQLLHLSKIFNNERLKNLQRQQMLKNKLNTFNLIQNHTQEIFNFICNNSTRKNIIQSKLNLIIQHINDYNIAFKNIKGSSIKNSSLINNSLTSSQFDNHKLSIDNVNSLSVKSIFNQKDYFSPKKKDEDIDLTNNFYNFYSNYNHDSLDNKLNTSYSHQFFNWKRNYDILNHKINSSISMNN